jgi:hypothetical protein
MNRIQVRVTERRNRIYQSFPLNWLRQKACEARWFFRVFIFQSNLATSLLKLIGHKKLSSTELLSKLP